MNSPAIDESFPRGWHAQILPARPLILPPRHFVYPLQAEEIERGALEILIRPGVLEGSGAPGLAPETGDRSLPCGPGLDSQTFESTSPVVKGTGLSVKGTGFSPYINPAQEAGALAPEGIQCETSEVSSRPFTPSPERDSPQPFLATCALGFRSPAVPTGLWTCPNPDEICALSGGYAYIINTTNPAAFTFIPLRPVLEIRPVPAQSLLLFAGHHHILAWGAAGQLWQSPKLSDEGLTLTSIEGEILHGRGWNMITDKETDFALDLRTGAMITWPPVAKAGP